MNNPNYMIRDLAGKNSTDRDDRPSYTSMIYGLALGGSSEGFVEVKLLGDGKNETSDFLYWKPNNDVGIEERGIFLPTTVSVTQGDLVVITTTGQTERKMIVTGVAGGGDVTASTMNAIQDNNLKITKDQNLLTHRTDAYMNYVGDPILDGTNLLKNSSFGSLDNWTIDYKTLARPNISLSNEYTNGPYQTVKFTFGQDEYALSMTQTYDFSNPMFSPQGSNWLVGTLYWYDLDNTVYSFSTSDHIDVFTNLIFTSNEDKLIFYSKNFNGIESAEVISKNKWWGRHRSVIFLDWNKANSLVYPFTSYINPKIYFSIKIYAARRDHPISTDTLYINRPKLEWGGIPTPWTP